LWKQGGDIFDSRVKGVFFFTVLIISLLLVIPESRAWIDEVTRNAKLAVEGNLPVFGIALVCSLAATVMSWIVSLFPKDEEEPGVGYRVIRIVSRGRGQ
jgi:hypothetical protein